MSEATGLEIFYMDLNNLSGSILEYFERFMPNLTSIDIANNSLWRRLIGGSCSILLLIQKTRTKAGLISATRADWLEGPRPAESGLSKFCNGVTTTFVHYIF